MPKGRRARKALVAAEALAVLNRLAHKGAYATAVASETAPVSCAIYSPRNGFPVRCYTRRCPPLPTVSISAGLRPTPVARSFTFRLRDCARCGQ